MDESRNGSQTKASTSVIEAITRIMSATASTPSGPRSHPARPTETICFCLKMLMRLRAASLPMLLKPTSTDVTEALTLESVVRHGRQGTRREREREAIPPPPRRPPCSSVVAARRCQQFGGSSTCGMVVPPASSPNPSTPGVS